MKPIRLHMLGHEITPPGTLGGTTRILIEFAKRWCLEPNVQITIHTSAEGAQTLSRYGVPEQITRSIWQGVAYSWSYNPLINMQQIRAAIHNVANVTDLRSSQLLIYSMSEFWQDVLPAMLLRRRFPQSRWLSGFYLFAPNPFLGFEGVYGQRKLKVPELKLLVQKYFYEPMTLAWIVRYADMLFLTNQTDADYFLRHGFSSDQIRAIYGGVDLAEAQSASAPALGEFAGCFVGRLHEQKGIEDLLRIWKRVCQHQPGRLAIIGTGLRPEYVARVRKLCTELGLDHCVEWLGYLDGIKKYEVLKRSRVFLHTTVYDNSGMAAAEGMAAGLPVVAYDLPPLRVAYPKGMLKAPPRDIDAFAQAVIALLTDSALYKATQQDAVDFAREWDWGKRAQESLDWIRQSLSH